MVSNMPDKEKAQTLFLSDLIKLAIKRKYKNPEFWANKIYKSRMEKIKCNT